MITQRMSHQTESRFTPDWRRRYFTGEPMRIGPALQWLFDDYIIEDRYGLKRVVGPVEKHPGNPLDTGPHMPWENAGAAPRHILYDPIENRYKGWYGACPNPTALRLGQAKGYHYHTLYAESLDGLHWTKPALDQFDFKGHSRTNIVLKRDQATCLLEDIWLHPNPTDEQDRFAALVKTVLPGESDRAIAFMYSPDGRRWRPAPDPVLFQGATDGSYSLAHNPVLKRWMIYRRPPTHAMRTIGFYAGRVQAFNDGESAKGGPANDKRHVSVCVSEDFRNWTHPCGVAIPDEIDMADVDSVTIIPYHDIFLGFIGLMDNAGLIPKQTQLMFSRDGLAWERLPDRPLFIANGMTGEWDAGQIMVSAALADGQRIRLYYSGTMMPQKEARLPRTGGLGLAWIDRDRWVGQQAGPEGGYLLTRRFLLDGNRIIVNCRCPLKRPAHGFEGLVRAELLRDPTEHHPAAAYAGFGLDECDPVPVIDAPGHVLSWRGSPDLSALRGKPVYIRFFIRNATLYTFSVLCND